MTPTGRLRDRQHVDPDPALGRGHVVDALADALVAHQRPVGARPVAGAGREPGEGVVEVGARVVAPDVRRVEPALHHVGDRRSRRFGRPRRARRSTLPMVVRVSIVERAPSSVDSERAMSRTGRRRAVVVSAAAAGPEGQGQHEDDARAAPAGGRVSWCGISLSCRARYTLPQLGPPPLRICWRVGLALTTELHQPRAYPEEANPAVPQSSGHQSPDAQSVLTSEPMSGSSTRCSSSTRRTREVCRPSGRRTSSPMVRR